MIPLARRVILSGAKRACSGIKVLQNCVKIPQEGNGTPVFIVACRRAELIEVNVDIDGVHSHKDSQNIENTKRVVSKI
jgi:hypothetical protein